MSGLFFRKPRVVYRAYADGGGVLLDLDTSLYFAVNRIGGLIWELLGSGSSRSNLIEGVRAEFPDAPPELDDDVTVFLEELEQRGLITTEEG